MRPIFAPAIEDRFVAIMVVAAAQHEALLDPHQAVAIGKSAFPHGGDEDRQQGSSRDAGIDRGTPLGMGYRVRQRGRKQRGKLLWREVVVLNGLALRLGTVLLHPYRLGPVADAVGWVGPDHAQAASVAVVKKAPDGSFIRAVAADDAVPFN